MIFGNKSQLKFHAHSKTKGRICWSIDTEFAVLNAMEGHTGAHISLGQEIMAGFSTKQKMST